MHFSVCSWCNFVLPCLVLSRLALPCLAWFCLALPCLVLPCLLLSCLVVSCPAQSYFLMSCLDAVLRGCCFVLVLVMVFSYLVLSCLVRSGLVLSCLVWPGLVWSIFIYLLLFFFLIQTRMLGMSSMESLATMTNTGLVLCLVSCLCIALPCLVSTWT